MTARNASAKPTVGPKLTPKVILEGTSLTLKTEIAFALNDHPTLVGQRRHRYYSPIISAESCGLTNVPWGRGMINFTSAEEALAMETYRTWVRLFELLRHYSWIVDRFHISTRAWQIAHRKVDCDFEWLEDRLLPLNFRLVFCRRSRESFSAARAVRLEVSDKPDQYDDLNVFIEEQELIGRLVASSRLPTLELDVSDNSVDLAADRIAEWLAETDGLSME